MLAFIYLYTKGKSVSKLCLLGSAEDARMHGTSRKPQTQTQAQCREIRTEEWFLHYRHTHTLQTDAARRRGRARPIMMAHERQNGNVDE
jgi:hypothetical protein